MKQIFPKEIIDSTVELHQFKHSTKSKVIYAVILLSLCIVIVLLPFIKVDIYTSARGIIKPDIERLSVSTMNSGKVIFTNLKNNKQVQKGDTLLILDNAIINEKLNLSQHQIEYINMFIEDLNYLINAKQIAISNLKSPKYTKEYLVYKQNLQELNTKQQKLKTDFDRSKSLFDKGVIAKVEFENTTLDYNLVVNSIHQLKQQQISTWQATLTEYKNSLLEIESSEKQLQENKSQFVVLAPLTGTLIGIKSIENGSFLNAGEVFANISPDTALLVECYINPQDIGMLKANNVANFQIDAYNYNQWGLATGNVIYISKDIEFTDNTAAFKVQCNLNENTLKLKNGFEGKLKKGMMLNAQFKLTERSLFDLLYDKVDDWVNPSKKEILASN